MDTDVVFFTVDDEAGGGGIDGDDIAASVLARFQSSEREDHQHLCAAVGAIAQALKDQGISLTPVAYFGATASSLDRLSRNPASGSDPAAASLLSFLAVAFPRVSPPVIRSRWTEVSETLVRILGFNSLPPGGVNFVTAQRLKVTQRALILLLLFSSTADVAPELLEDLLSSIALSVSDKEKSADQMASIARLLHLDILASEHEEAIFAAMEALKGLICACIDESLIEQGVVRIKTADGELRQSGPTIIAKICATIEGFLGYRYNAVWDMSFQVLSTTFVRLDMQNLSDEDFAFRKQLHECVGSAVSTMGPENFLSILPLNLDADVTDANVWLLPILKQHVAGARLSFFAEHILVLAKEIKQKSYNVGLPLSHKSSS
ncbi:hypothetical protein BHM03_00037251 [Ensete ventricosum]|nr:hypothetical protein BHM03_00037251 [Ensete ventricosum]